MCSTAEAKSGAFRMENGERWNPTAETHPLCFGPPSNPARAPLNRPVQRANAGGGHSGKLGSSPSRQKPTVALFFVYSHLLTHSPTHSLAHSPPPTHSLAHSPAHSLARSLATHSLTHSLTRPLTRSPTLSLARPLSHSLSHSLARSLTCPPTHWPTRALTHSLARSLITHSPSCMYITNLRFCFLCIRSVVARGAYRGYFGCSLFARGWGPK